MVLLLISLLILQVKYPSRPDWGWKTHFQHDTLNGWHIGAGYWQETLSSLPGGVLCWVA
jgi:hypothetical protein